MSARPKRLSPATHYEAVVGQVLAWLRERRQWTQGQMAEKVGVSHPVWSRIERGEAPLASSRLRDAASVLGTTPGEVHRLADRVEAEARARGVKVVSERPPDWLVAGSIFVGVAALAALVASLLTRERK